MICPMNRPDIVQVGVSDAKTPYATVKEGNWVAIALFRVSNEFAKTNETLEKVKMKAIWGTKY